MGFAIGGDRPDVVRVRSDRADAGEVPEHPEEGFESRDEEQGAEGAPLSNSRFLNEALEHAALHADVAPSVVVEAVHEVQQPSGAAKLCEDLLKVLVSDGWERGLEIKEPGGVGGIA